MAFIVHCPATVNTEIIAQICRALYELIGSFDELQYKIELAAAKYENVRYVGPQQKPVKDRLALLRSKQEAWRTLSWASVHCFLSDTLEWQLDGSIIGDYFHTNNVELRLMPSIVKGTARPGMVARKKYTIAGDTRMRVHAIDAGQDLMVGSRDLDEG